MQKNNQLRHQRLRRYWRLSDVADQLGTTVTTVQRWERGSQLPGLYYRAKLCELFDLSAWELGFEAENVQTVQQTLQPSEEEEAFLPENDAEPAMLWTVPFTRNPHFTGRDGILRLLDQRLSTLDISQREEDRHMLALTQVQALTGLGGVGKTQIAVEYAYQAFARKRYRYTLWITATNEEAILTGFVSLAGRLQGFRSYGEADQRKLAEMMIHWLEQYDEAWLLIFDNVDDLSVIQPYLPRYGKGSILLTTRVRAVGSFASSIEIEPMEGDEGAQFLLKRGQHFDNASEHDIIDARELAIALGQLPLALDQAGAYIEETGCSIQDYLQLYQRNRYTLLARRGMQAVGYPESVVTTWSLSFQRVEEINQAAGDLLCLCALLAPDHIPQELLTEGAAYWPSPLCEVAADPISFNQMIEHLLRFSLMKRLPQEKLLSIHPLVQAVQQERMPQQEQRQWAERMIRAVHALFPRDPRDAVASWSQCQRYVEQALACEKQIQQQQLLFSEAADVLEWTGIYLRERASYLLAEPLLLHALSIREHQEMPAYPDSIRTMNNLAASYSEQGKYEQAESFFQRALRTGEQYGGSHHPSAGTALNGLGTLYRVQGQYTQAEVFYRQALDIWEHQERADPWMISESLDGLATLYREQGKYEQAETFFIRELDICEQQLGADHAQTSAALDGLANVYMEQGKYEQAEPLYQRALHIQEQQTGPDHPLVAYVLSNLAVLSLIQGKYLQAEDLCLGALRIWEQQGGQDHPQIVYPLTNLAKACFCQKKYEQAEALCLRALRIWEQQGQPDHLHVSFTLNNLANIYIYQGKYEQAEPVCLRALHILEQQGADNHPQMAYTLHRFALLSDRQGKDEEAETLYLRSLQLCEQLLGSEHSGTTEVLFDLAGFRQAHGSTQEALDLYQRVLMVRERVLGVAHPLTLAARASLDALAGT